MYKRIQYTAFFFCALTLAGCSFITQKIDFTATEKKEESFVVTSHIIDWKTHKNDCGGFSFQFPSSSFYTDDVSLPCVSSIYEQTLGGFEAGTIHQVFYVENYTTNFPKSELLEKEILYQFAEDIWEANVKDKQEENSKDKLVTDLVPVVVNQYQGYSFVVDSSFSYGQRGGFVLRKKTKVIILMNEGHTYIVMHPDPYSLSERVLSTIKLFPPTAPFQWNEPR